MNRKLLSKVLAATLTVSVAGSAITVLAADNEEEKKVTLTMMNHTAEEAKVNWEDYAVETFMELHPNVTIEVQRMSMDAYNQTISAKFASDDAPDIFYEDSSMIVPMIDNGYVADLTDTEAAKNLVEGATSALSRDGAVYAIPFNTNTYVVTYNKTCFEKAGITEVPKTESEFYAVCDQLKEAGITPFALGYGESWVIMGEIAADYITNWLIPDTNAIIDIEARNTKFADSEFWRGCLERIAKRYTYGNADPFGTDWASACTSLVNGECAMIINGDWTASNASAFGDVSDFGAFALPITENPEDAKIASLAGGQGYCVNANSENVEIAKEFLNHLTRQDCIDNYMESCQEVCLVKNAVPEDSQGPLADVQNMVTNSSLPFGGNVNFTGEYFDTVIACIADFLLEGGEDVDAALANLDAEFDRIAGV